MISALHENSLPEIIFLLVVISALSVANLLIYTGAYRLFRKFLLKRRWASNIPGNPYAIDTLLTAFFAPFPELNDFNAVTTSVNLHQSIIILHGFPPKARYWGVQLFLIGAAKNMSQHCLSDKEIKLNKDGSYTVVLCKKEFTPEWSTNAIDTQDSLSCHMVVRGYLTEPGMRWYAPSIHEIKPNTFKSLAQVLESSPRYAMENEKRICGQWSTAMSDNSAFVRLTHVIAMNVLVLCLSLVSHGGYWGPSQAIVACLIGGFFGRVNYAILFKLAELKYRKMLLKRFATPPLANTQVILPDPHASVGNHPNHTYFSIPYDARNCDVRIKGYLNSGFRYTSIHCYHWNSIPLPEYLYDETIIPDSLKTYSVYLTCSPNKGDLKINEIDVSESPVGIAIVRLVYPDDESVVQQCKPLVEAVEKGKRA